MALKDTVKSWLKGQFGPYASTTVDVTTDVERVYRFVATLSKDAADTNAADNTTTHHLLSIPAGLGSCQVLSAGYTPDATLTADDTNYANVLLLSSDGTGVASSVTASVNTTTAGSNSWAVGVEVDLTVASTYATLAAGSNLALAITKAGGGVIVPAGVLTVCLEQV